MEDRRMPVTFPPHWTKGITPTLPANVIVTQMINRITAVADVVSGLFIGKLTAMLIQKLAFYVVS